VECIGFGSARKSDAKFNDSGRVTYLLNIFTLMLRHEVFITDEFSSGALYALSLGMQIKYVPNNISKDFTSEVVKTVRSEASGFFKTDFDWILNFAPDILTTNVNAKKFVELSWNELGFNSMLSPKQIAELDWVPYSGVEKYNKTYSESLDKINYRKFYNIK